MTTVGEVSVKISADLAPLRKAQADAKKIMGDIDKALNNSAKTVGGAFGATWNAQVGQFSAGATQVTSNLGKVGEGFKKTGTEAKNATQPVRQYNQFIKDSGQFSQQAAFQFNDLFVQLASGQSAFTAITQQGAQLSQMFAPGTGIGAAAKQTGAAFATFLVNPLNLAVVGIAAVAGAIPLIYNAVTGDKSATAKASLIEFDQLVKNIGLSSESSAKSLEKLSQQKFTQDDLAFQATLSRKGQQTQFLAELEKVAVKAREANNSIAVLEASTGLYGSTVSSAAQQQDSFLTRLVDLIRQAKTGAINVQQLRDGLREVSLDPAASKETQKLAEQLFASTQEAFNLEGQLNSTAKAARQLGTAFRDAMAIKGGRNGSQTVATDLAARINPDGIDSLVERLRAQKNELEDVAGELGVSAIPAPERRPTRELGYSGDEFGTGKKPKKAGGSGERDKDFLANLQSETMYLQQQLDIMGKSYDERVRLTDQYKLEKDIRDALTRLGEKATPAQKAAVEEQIRLQQQLNSELQKQEAINQVVSDAQIEAAGLIGSAINGAITGSKDLKSAMLDVAIAIAKAALQAQLLQSFSNGKGGLSIGGSIISALFGGLAGARAKGGPVSQGSSYLVGEEGPEIFTANRSGVIVPNNKLGSGSIGGNSNSTSTTSDVRVWVDDDGNWQAAVERIATKTSANTTRQGIAEYDKSMPNRIQQINQNPSRR